MKENPTPEELLKARRIAKIAASFPEIEQTIQEMTKTALLRMYATVRKGSLTNEAAMNYCLELYSYDRLLKRFEDKIKTGDRDGEAQNPNG